MTSYLLLAFLAFAVSPEDAPDIAPIIAGLEKTEASIRDLAVSTEYVHLQKAGLKVDKPVRLSLRTEFIVTRDGKSWYECVGESIPSRSDGMVTQIDIGRKRATYDGKSARSTGGDVDGRFRYAAIDLHPSWDGVNPLEYTTHYNGEPVSKTLKGRPPTFVGRADWDGRPVVIVETPATIHGAGYKARFWIDPERRIVVRRALMIQLVPDKSPWQEYSRIESHDHKEIAPGIWLPMRFKSETVRVARDGKPEELSWSYEGTNSDWNVNQDRPTSTFHLEFQPGLRIWDRGPNDPPDEEK